MESKGRILVVDDEVNARNALTGAAARRGLRGRDGRRRLQGAGQDGGVRARPGADRSQDARHGRHPAARAASARATPDLPVVVMTAFGEVETAVGAMRAGARDYLSKPVNVGELSVVVAREMAAAPAPRRGGPAARAPGREVQLRQHHRQRGADAGGVQDRRADRGVARERAHHRRVGDGQGADRGRHPRAQPARRGAVREAALRGAGRVAARERAVRARARLVHGRGRAGATAASSRPTTARCSSTRSARSRRPSR